MNLHALLRTTALAALLPTCCLAGIFGRVAFTPQGDFSEAAVRRGVEATRSQCEQTANTIWVATPDSGEECLKFWVAGFGDKPARRAIIFFHGDVWEGEGRTSRSYLDNSNEKLQQNADSWAKRLGMPYIFVGRPGTYGSSGDHMQRRRLGESLLVSAAMDTLKKRFGIEEWVVAGQSGGGHLTSALLTERSDIVCAIPTSAVSSPRIRYLLAGRKVDVTGYADSYEPSEHLDRSRMHPALRVFVLGNPQDRNVFWPAQTVMADALRKIGTPVEVLEGQGTGPDGHGLSNSSRIVAGWCAHDMETKEILRLAAEGLRG